MRASFGSGCRRETGFLTRRRLAAMREGRVSAWLWLCQFFLQFVVLAPVLAEPFVALKTPARCLQEPAFLPLPLGSIRPAGWLASQLRIQAAGLTGHLDEFWPDIRDSGWIGGEAEGWERAPYWLDGLVPLAYQLDAENLKGKVRRFVEYTLRHQQSDGWLGPEQSATGNYRARDPWPVFVMMKALTQYQEVTGDERIIPALLRYLRCLDRQLDQRPLFEWNRMRWQDGVLTIYWLYERRPEQWLLALAEKMHRQGYDWTQHFLELPHRKKAQKWEHTSHVVNNAMGVKAPGLWYRQSEGIADRETVFRAIQTLDRYHGQATAMFSGDECLAGKMPSQGTETCAVVEYMYSLEVLLSVLGDPAFGDRLEQLAFNALPAPFRVDMWSRQYVQQVNQPIVRLSEDRIYTTNGKKANLFGLETNYGCCTANMHQGWPKFVSHLWMKTAGEEGLVAIAYGPSTVRCSIREAQVRIELSTEYPFSEDLHFVVHTDRPVAFPLQLRIPAWCEKPTLQVGDEAPFIPETGSFCSIRREWSGSVPLRLYLPMPIRIERRYRDAVCLKRGPLVFSLQIGTAWQQVGGEEPHADWEVYPTTPWNYALEIDQESPETSVTFQHSPVGANPFDAQEVPIRALVKGCLLPEWTLDQNTAAAPPQSPVFSEQPLETLTLIPYGAAKLRITEFPTLRTQKEPAMHGSRPR